MKMLGADMNYYWQWRIDAL